MVEYAVVIEKGPSSFGAYVPDLPGCVAVADTEAEVRELIREAIEFHLESMQLHGEAIPQPTSRMAYVEASHPALKFAVIIEKGPTSYGAYVPDLDGCVAAGDSEAEVRRLIREGIEIHLDDMRRDGESIPAPTSRVDYVTVTEPASVA